MLVSLAWAPSIRPIARSDEMMGKLAKNDEEWIDPYNHRQLRHSVIDWISGTEWSHAVTLAINRQVSAHTVGSMFKLFCLEMDRYKFGTKHVSRIPSLERLQAFVTIEHPHSNIHMHAAVNFTEWLQRPLTKTDEYEFNKIWEKCTRDSGDLLIEELTDVRGWIRYITKEFYNPAADWMMASFYHRS